MPCWPGPPLESPWGLGATTSSRRALALVLAPFPVAEVSKANAAQGPGPPAFRSLEPASRPGRQPSGRGAVLGPPDRALRPGQRPAGLCLRLPAQCWARGPSTPRGADGKGEQRQEEGGQGPEEGPLPHAGQHVPGPGAPQVHSEEHWSPEASPHAAPRGTGQNPLACPSSRAPEPERRAGSAQGTHRGHWSAVPHDPSRGGVPCRAVAPGAAAAGGDSLSLPRRPLPVLMRPPPWLGNPETHSP